MLTTPRPSSLSLSKGCTILAISIRTAGPSDRRQSSRELQASPLDGAASWLTAWARAFLTGCSDEADRLLGGPFELPPEAAWCPDRLAVAPDALQARSVERLAPLLRYLADSAPLGGRGSVPSDVRAHAAVLHGRLALNADRDGVLELLEHAQYLVGHDDAEVLAAQAALARLRPVAADTAPNTAAARADDPATLARRAWQAERCPAAAVELFYAEHGGTDKIPDVLADARGLVDELPFPAGRLETMLDVLIQPVPEVIWAAAAERALRDGDRNAARRLVERVRTDADPLLLAEMADLRVRIAEESGEPDQTVADLLDEAGTAAMSVGQPLRAIATFEKALARVNGHPAAGLHLADSFLSDGWGKPLSQVEPQFRRALDLLAQVRSRQPLDTETSWSLLTESYLYSLLASDVTPESRAVALWQAPLAAARAIAFDPSDGRRWGRLADTLTSLKCWRAALVLSDYAFQLTPDDPEVMQAQVVALSNLGRFEEALSVLDQAERQKPGPWYRGVRAYLLWLSADEHPGEVAATLKEARTAADEAMRNQPETVWFHQVLAAVLLGMGETRLAAEEWDHIWRESRLDEAEGLVSACQAAVELRLGADAVSPATRPSTSRWRPSRKAMSLPAAGSRASWRAHPTAYPISKPRASWPARVSRSRNFASESVALPRSSERRTALLTSLASRPGSTNAQSRSRPTTLSCRWSSPQPSLTASPPTATTMPR